MLRNQQIDPQRNKEEIKLATNRDIPTKPTASGPHFQAHQRDITPTVSLGAKQSNEISELSQLQGYCLKSGRFMKKGVSSARSVAKQSLTHWPEKESSWTEGRRRPDIRHRLSNNGAADEKTLSLRHRGSPSAPPPFFLSAFLLFSVRRSRSICEGA